MEKHPAVHAANREKASIHIALWLMLGNDSLK
jgi:hypothetical protein